MAYVHVLRSSLNQLDMYWVLVLYSGQVWLCSQHNYIVREPYVDLFTCHFISPEVNPHFPILLDYSSNSYSNTSSTGKLGSNIRLKAYVVLYVHKLGI